MKVADSRTKSSIGIKPEENSTMAEKKVVCFLMANSIGVTKYYE